MSADKVRFYYLPARIISPKRQNVPKGRIQAMRPNLFDIIEKKKGEATPEENILWDRLQAGRLDGYEFTRQHPIHLYIVDFFCRKRSLIIELDGKYHLSRKKEDHERTEYLRNQGFHMLRFWNGEVRSNIDGVCEKIFEILKRPPAYASSRKREDARKNFADG